jgi:hypothetical protein
MSRARPALHEIVERALIAHEAHALCGRAGNGITERSLRRNEPGQQRNEFISTHVLPRTLCNAERRCVVFGRGERFRRSIVDSCRA